LVLAHDEKTRSVVLDISGPAVKEVCGFTPSQHAYTSVFLKGGSRVAATRGGKTVHVWDAATGREVHKFGPFEHAGGLHAVRGGEAMVYVARDGAVRTWDLSGPDPKETMRRVSPKNGEIGWNGSSVSADGGKLACGVGNSVQVWDLKAPGDQPATVVGAHAPLVALTADGKTLFASNHVTTEVVDLTAAPPTRRPVAAGADRRVPLAVTPAGRLLGYQVAGAAEAVG
jgi:WD40 repeat protein